MGGEAAALDAREVLSHAIDLADIRAAAQQRPRRRLLFLKRDAGGRRDQIRRSAAGEKNENEIVGARRIGKLHHAFGAGEARRVGDRMTGFDDGNMPGRPAIAMPGHRDAIEPVFRHAGEIMLFCDFDQRTAGLAGGKDDEPPARRRLRQVRRQAAATVAPRRPRSETGIPENRGFAWPNRVFRRRARGVWQRGVAASIFAISRTRRSTAIMATDRLPTRRPARNSKPRSTAAWSSTFASRTDVQNIDLMNLAGFCRNCLSNWMKDAADAKGLPMTKDESREIVYGMPFDEWRAKYQKEASAGQKAAFEKASQKH